MVSYEKFWPSKAFCCLDFDLGTKILLSLIILIRFICMILGCLYGPYLYLVLPLGGLYLAADVLLLYTIFGSGLKSLKQEDENSDSPEGNFSFFWNPDFSIIHDFCFVFPDFFLIFQIFPTFEIFRIFQFFLIFNFSDF